MQTKYLRCLLLAVFLLVAITVFAPNAVQAASDTTPPEILDIQVQQTWDTTSNKVTFKIPEGLDTLKRVSVTDKNGNSVRFTQSNGLYTLTITANGTYTITAVDRAGNQQVKTFTVDKIDTEAPLTPIIEVPDYGKWTNQDVKISLASSDDQSGIAAFWYSTVSISFDKTTWTKLTPSFGMATLTLSKEQTSNFFFAAEDRAGNISAVSSASVKIDKTPAADLTVRYATGSNSGYVQALNGTNIYKDKITFSAKATDNLSGVAYYEYQIQSSHYNSGWIKVKAQEEGFTQTFTGTNGRYTVSVRVYDKAGNVSNAGVLPACIMENADSTIPTPTIAAACSGKAYDGAWTRGDVSIAVSGSVAVSGIEYYEYQIDYLDPSQKDQTWQKVPISDGIASAIQNKDANATYFFRAVSYAGNRSQAVSMIVRVQKTAPAAATLKPDTAGKNGWYSKLPTYTVDTGSQSGFSAPVKYTITYSYNGKEQPAVVYNGKNAPKITADGTWVFKITTVDEAGNTVTGSTTTFRVDTKAPVVTGQYDNNTVTASIGGVEGFTAIRTLTVTVKEQNFLANKAIVSVKDLDTGEVLAYTWTSAADTHTCVIPITAEGHYSVSVSIADAAGNKGKITFAAGTKAAAEFIVDPTPAQITVSYDNNEAKNDSFFLAPRTLTVTVVERNFDLDKIAVSLRFTPENGEEALLALDNWQHDGSKHWATIVLDTDGYYSVSVSGEDTLGNITADANYEGAAPKAWTLDTQISEPKIEQLLPDPESGIIAPKITVLDQHIDSITVKLLYSNLSEKNADVTDKLLTKDVLRWTNIAGGKELSLDIYPRDKNLDGEYTLTVTLTDKAGNEATTTKTYYVNYYGSVYIYDEYLANLRNGYVQKVEKDLILTEYNPTGVEEGSLRVQIMLDGNIVSLPIFRVEPVEAIPGENGWRECRYVISASNFMQEGVYSVIVSSKDTNGNILENISENRRIRFGVDRSIPELPSIIGLEKATVSVADELTVTLQAMDNVALDRIAVFIGKREVASWTDLTGYYVDDCRFVIPAGEKQAVRIVVIDKAGNVLDTDTESFVPAYEFNRVVTVNSSFFLRLYENKPLFYGCIAGVVLLLAAGIVVPTVLSKKKIEE